MTKRLERDKPRLIGDAEVAKYFGMSTSWVRQQRYRRRQGLPHHLTIDPVMVGSLPRYRERDILAFLEGLPTDKPQPDAA